MGRMTSSNSIKHFRPVNDCRINTIFYHWLYRRGVLELCLVMLSLPLKNNSRLIVSVTADQSRSKGDTSKSKGNFKFCFLTTIYLRFKQPASLFKL